MLHLRRPPHALGLPTGSQVSGSPIDQRACTQAGGILYAEPNGNQYCCRGTDCRPAIVPSPNPANPLNVATPNNNAPASPFLQPFGTPPLPWSPSPVFPGYEYNAQVVSSTTFNSTTAWLGLGALAALILWKKRGGGRSAPASSVSVAPDRGPERPERARPKKKKRPRSRSRSRSRSRKRTR